MRKLLKDTLQISHVVMLIVQLSSETQATSVNDGSMVTIIADQVVTATDDRRDDTGVDRESG